MANGKPLVRQGGRTQQGNISIESVTDLSSELGAKVDNDDSRLTDSREWIATTVSQVEAEAGTASTRRAWTAQRVRQAIAAWFHTVSTSFTRTLLGRSNAAQVRDDLGLGTAATRDVGTGSGNVLGVSSDENFGLAGRAWRNDLAGFLNAALTQRFTSGAKSEAFENHPDWHNGYVIGSGSDNMSGSKSGILMSNSASEISFFYNLQAGDTTLPPIVKLHHTGNILSTTGQSTQYPMTQKAVTDAINARGFEDASGILTVTSGALSNDMSSFLSQTTKATMRSNLEVPQLNASPTQQGGLKARLDGTTLYLSSNGTNP